MPVEYRQGDLFSFSGSLAHGTNATGKMGKGIAVKFKQEFPDMFLEYEKLCKEGQHTCGRIFPYRSLKVTTSTNLAEAISGKMPDPVEPGQIPGVQVFTTQLRFSASIRYIYNICIKPHWRAKAETYAIWAGLRAAVKHLEHQVELAAINQANDPDKGWFQPVLSNEIALPQIGCGLGGLDWETQVKPIIEEIGSQTPCSLIVYLQGEAKGTNESNINPHDADPTK